jgi:hypothetical protein
LDCPLPNMFRRRKLRDSAAISVTNGKCRG